MKSIFIFLLSSLYMFPATSYASDFGRLNKLIGFFIVGFIFLVFIIMVLKEINSKNKK